MESSSSIEPWVWDVPEFLNIGAACSDAHLGTPVAERTAMIVEDDALGTSAITYAELADRTSRFAQLLRELGVDAGERVLVRLPNSIDYPTAFLGTLKRGAIAVPTSTLLTAEEVRYLVEDSGATALVIDAPAWKAMAAQLQGAGSLRQVILGGVALERALANVGNPAAPERTRASDPAYLVYTSGTTGYPKGVLHGHRALIGRTPASQHWFDFDPGGDRIVHSGKFNWTYVLLGRKDDIIKSFGYRVSPYEVERVLKGHPAVADCACIAEDVGSDKRLVVAYVIPQPGVAASPDELLAFGRAHLAAYKAPRIVYLASHFPRTRNGKILRREITANIATARSAPSNPTGNP